MIKSTFINEQKILHAKYHSTRFGTGTNYKIVNQSSSWYWFYQGVPYKYDAIVVLSVEVIIVANKYPETMTNPGKKEKINQCFMGM